LKFSLSWISEHIEFKSNITIDMISKSLTNLGLEVESIQDNSKELKGFLIAKIIDISPHPNADRLNICKVELGNSEVSVVCGASNIKKNLKVVFAPIGTTIPSNGMILKKKDIRGFTGDGMLCSLEELCLEDKSDGIAELPDDAPVGKIYADWAELSDPIFEIGLTPNRGDCASILGLARELSAIGLGELKNRKNYNIKGSYKSPINWKIDLDSKNINACSYVKGRHFKGLKNIESPVWLKKRLISIGLKPISTLVDLTNFITFDLGRPLHVFDAKKIQGDLCIRMASDNEDLIALDGKKYRLNKNILIISDENKPVSIAGVMGGVDTSCDENTTEIFLESAYFNKKSIAISGRSLNILSDARYRFERGVDPEFIDEGINIMTNLVLGICGGEVSEDVYAGKVDLKKIKIDFNCAKFKMLCGIEMSVQEQISILLKLGFEVKNNQNILSLLVPTWRHDISDEVDIVEELLRVKGYDNLEDSSLDNFISIRKPVLSIVEHRNRLISSALVKRGLYELVTFSFFSEMSASLFKNNISIVTLDNPISQELSIMRFSLLPNIIDHFINNSKKGLKNSGLFEVGSVYYGDKEEDQFVCSAGVRSGNISSRHWSIDNREVDIYDIKKDAFKALESVGISSNNLRLDKDLPDWYHPGRSGAIKIGKILLGHFGELHPKYSEKYGIRIVCFELYHNNFPKNYKKKSNKNFIPYSLMPIKRDFAFLAQKETNASELVSSIEKSLITINYIQLLEVNVFDVYSKNLSEGNDKKSLAIEIIFQPIEYTLKENQILDISNLIVESVKKDTNAILRD
jgi:phenylalanyl-tRNA synthetase beta chain